MNKVKLLHVLAWICPSCNEHNSIEFKRKPMPEDMLREAYQLDEWQAIPEELTGDVLEVPTEVSCKCGDIFEVEAPDKWL